MRNLILLILTATFLSCGAKKLVTSKEKRFEGNWYLEKITYNFKYEIGNEDTATGFYNLILTPINGNTSKSYNLFLKDLDMSSMKWQESRIIDGVEFTIEMRFKKFD